MTTYRVFKRRAWKRNPAYPQGWEPYGGARKIPVDTGLTYDEARRMCDRENGGLDRNDHSAIFHEFEREE